MMPKLYRKILEEAAQTHQANIHSLLEHRLQVARAQGNQELIHLLEAEFDQLFSKGRSQRQ
ncbi:MAG TPA: hypothetical protein V6D03_06610 [Candidatus Caenarcaniphilales bacterium]